MEGFGIVLSAVWTVGFWYGAFVLVRWYIKKEVGKATKATVK